MTRNQPTLAALLFLIVITIACRREPINQQPGNQQSNQKTKLSQIAHEFGKLDITYNEDGSVKETMLSNLRGYLERAQFQYDDKKLKSILLNGVEFKYSYANGKLSSIEVFPEQGSFTERYEYVYNNDVLTERLKFVKTTTATQLNPYSKIKYTYSAGNLVKTESFSWIFGGWNAAGEEVFYEYDNKENTLSHFEAEPFLLENTFMKNNPLKIVYKTAHGDVTKTITHSYTYNQHQQPVTRKTVVTAVGFGGSTTNYAVSYGK